MNYILMRLSIPLSTALLLISLVSDRHSAKAIWDFEGIFCSSVRTVVAKLVQGDFS